ncbi:bifunctional phosphopantothenoylcysteine decarboxylase/phosphopantothenate--cysteine ligase CoaBC [Corynebacterium tuberculostearicum]|uniref:Coenzyme A biosynthesis bifunctional protein CoaBC n=1 Tax=Corynebacterium tuberculostearicum TaxID=38304 RepID=A0AAE4NKP6_9CORY|nr:bifunctional phosphopantothenoylcysteine decarboxylase/phosphopantothenate--cysteine ligase CoaBC [Corynebacterium tuberculostearicum]MDV2419028.1 bifunctional phosphopantothenoylcysteine decarboxylase/phosphopantothenate--cysteine ligase CoaBC [Corynebacterium tuberculostearicum]MDV2432964.1 bifunctional phosphopantothenoylcysteine decarboxylase/phosphopantothenate--cysteine ligase CoaBC [Corynebacterium tuberculostearicum]WKE59400.1 bifunctional phosphopantothenoylcysteine decarboxylase/pho
MTELDTSRNIVVGVAGGIAAYKACHLVRNFKEAGDDVRVVPTENALNFVGAATFEALSGHPVSTTVFDAVDEVQHVNVGQHADVVVIAPATADLIARLATGRADDLLTSTVLVATCPVIVAPAMHTEMWLNPATQDNVATLRRRGITVIEPAHGRLTGADSGPGRLPEPDQIAEVVRTELAGYRVEHRWKGKKVVISAGGTREELDPVRYLGNRSSGRQGFALAEWACQMGADVTIVAGNTASLPVPSGAKVRSIISTRELEQAMREEARDADVVIMAAAVSDFRPAEVAESKMKKGQADDVLSTLHLVENPDVLKGLVAARDRAELPAECVIVGFAAETGDADKSALEYAQEKFARKGCDVIMANEVGRDKTFGQKSNEGWILRSGLEPQRVEHGSKQVVAAQILAAVNEMLRD